MNDKVRSKLDLQDERIVIDTDEILARLTGIFTGIGCTRLNAELIAQHLCEASLCGMESHGIMRALQYADQFESGYMKAETEPAVIVNPRGAKIIDGNGGHGIPAMQLALETACEDAANSGLSVLAIRNLGHTGRLGAFAEAAAYRGNLCIIFGGGGRKKWRQVAPYGGRKAMLPTNPYCIAIPGGHRGPVVLDFATSKIAGGWIYAARSAGARLPDNVLMDVDGNVTRDPEDYFRGGAILPSGEQKGYALALVAEIMAEAMLGPTDVEGNWLMITLDTSLYREPGRMQHIAEEILDELRQCPPAPGFDRVEIPGEREREYRDVNAGSAVAIPAQTWQQILELSEKCQLK